MTDNHSTRKATAVIYIMVLLSVAFSAFKMLAPVDRGPALVLHNVKLVTPDGTLPQTGLVVHGDTITRLISEDQVEAYRQDPKNDIRDLEGCTIIPGLRDAHGHLGSLGKTMEILQLGDAEDLYDLLNRVESHLVTFKGSWLEGRGWDQSSWQGDSSLPSNIRLLDQYTGDTPVFLTRVDGHAAWCNSKALAIAGITEDTPDPEGGRIMRDDNGGLSGLLLDNAMDLVRRHIPKSDDKDVERRLRRGLNRAAQYGLVQVHDAGMSRAQLRALERIAKKHSLPVRVYAMVATDDEAFLKEQLKEGPRVGLYDDRLTVRAIKIVYDGALGSRGAALFEDYSDKPGSRGLLLRSERTFERHVKMASEAGFQVCTHAIGDRANHLTLNAYAKVPSARHRLEHAQVLKLSDIPRLAELGVLASMQPKHATTDMRWAEKRLGAKRLKGAYAWKSVLKSGARLVFGSDFPVEPVSPLRGLYAAMTRQDEDGEPFFGWRPEERLTLSEALRAFTEGGAYASFEERRRGRLAVGQKADLTVLSSQPGEKPREWLESAVAMTFVNGKQIELLPLD